MPRDSFSGSRPRLSESLVQFLGKTFFQKKLNNWFGYLFIAGLALVFGFLLAKNMMMGIGLFAGIVGLFIAVICISSAEAGLYIILFFSFFAFFFSRLFFKGEMPIGVMFDGLVVATMLGMLMGRTDFKKNVRNFTRVPLVIFIFFTLFYNAVQVFNPNSMSSGTDFLAFRKFLGYVFVMFMAYTVFDTKQKIKNYIVALFIASTLSAFYGCIQQFHGYFNFEMELILADPHGLGLIFVNGEFRKFSTMSDPSSFGILMAVCAVFFLIIAINQTNKQYKYILIAGCILMVLAVGYSGTRTAYATAVAGLAFFILLNFEKKSTRVFGFVSALVLAVLLYGPSGGNKTIQRFRTTFIGAEDESYKVRLIARAFIQPYIRSHPIGGGLGTTGFNGAREHPGHYLANFQPDSSYIKRGAETGWIGLGIVCILYFFTLKVGLKEYFRARNEKIKVLAAACVTSLFAFYIAEFAQVAVGGVSDVLVYYPILAMLLRMNELDDGEEDEEVPEAA
ncbi:MAG TPA: O-antigen ligase family protein [Flavisolibacter sp.]|nr:O-antigen ligase family protein [Flavisolibacter sp.]